MSVVCRRGLECLERSQRTCLYATWSRVAYPYGMGNDLRVIISQHGSQIQASDA